MNILRSLPFLNRESVVDTPTGHAALFAYQIAVTVSLILKSGRSRPFPAILDTGFNQAFALTETHLEQWLGLKASQMKTWGSASVMGQVVPLKEAKVAIHQNVRWKTALSGTKPFQLESREAIMVYPHGRYPRLPLLGLRAIVDSNLVLAIDGSKKMVNLRTKGLLSALGF